MTTKQRLMTADELLTMPRGDGRKYELVRGVLIEKMPTGHTHGVVVAIITTLLNLFVGSRNYGQVSSGEPGYLLEIGPDTVRAPDIAWIAPGRIPEGTPGFPNLAPDLVVEVKSPSNSYAEMHHKAEMWLGFGARQVWNVDPERVTVTLYQPNFEPVELGEDDNIDGGDLLPGFTAPVWSFFRWEK